MITLARIQENLGAFRPVGLDATGSKHAAVALVLRERVEQGIEALFIERARHDQDPWSGQMALPGGRVESFDTSARKAAERETAEEVGIDLSGGRYLGRLDDQQGRHRGHVEGIVVCGYVYVVEEAGVGKGNHEVEDIVWVPLQRFLDASYYTHVVHPTEPDERFPGVRVSDKDHQVVWGLTRRFMISFFSTINVVFEG